MLASAVPKGAGDVKRSFWSFSLVKEVAEGVVVSVLLGEDFSGWVGVAVAPDFNGVVVVVDVMDKRGTIAAFCCS